MCCLIYKRLPQLVRVLIFHVQQFLGTSEGQRDEVEHVNPSTPGSISGCTAQHIILFFNRQAVKQLYSEHMALVLYTRK